MFIINIAIIIILAGIDQLIKYLIYLKIDFGEIINVVKIGDVKLFSLTHITNTGAAWSIMSGKRWFLIVLPTILIIAALIYLYKIRKSSKLSCFSLSMVISGGIGNIIDRIRMGEVIDYIKTDFIDFPIFNFADICVVVGAILFYVSVISSDIKQQKKKRKPVNEN